MENNSTHFCRKFSHTGRRNFLQHFANRNTICRNAIFAGLLPVEIEKQFPEQWKNDDEEGGKNMFEEEFFKSTVKALGKR